MKLQRVALLVFLLPFSCPGCGGGTGVTGRDSQSGIYGRTVLWPTQPVSDADHPDNGTVFPRTPVSVYACAPSTGDTRPGGGARQSDDSCSKGERVARVVSDSKGEYRIGLSPGMYVVQGEGPNGDDYPYEVGTDVTVPDAAYVEVIVRFETGIR